MRINHPSDLKSFSQSLKQFFLTVGQNNFGNKIPFSSGKVGVRFGQIQTMKIFLLCK